MKKLYKNPFKVFMLIGIFSLLFNFNTFAQFGCGSGVVLTNGYTQLAITTPGTAGVEDWNINPTGTSINASYWDDDVYLFEYTAGATMETISMVIFTRNTWNGIGIFDDCIGTTFSNELDADGSSTGNISRTVTATIAAGNTVYIAVGQWGTPNGLDFDVTNFTVTQILCPTPTILTATNLTSTSADLGWTENGTATTWDIEFGIAGFAPTGTPTIVGTTTNPHNLTGLTANTAYDFYVRADCGGSGTSAWAGPYSFTTLCATQLAGTFTIGAAGNYATFTDAVNALVCGVSAPVVFNVLAGSGPYNEQITIPQITGTSATNTITFNGNGETITFSTSTSPNNYIIRLDGADYITFDNLNVVSQSTTNNFAIHLTNDADFNTINNCTIDLTSTFSSTGTTNGGIVVSGSLTSITSAGVSGANNTFTNNTIIGGYYGITINGFSSAVNSLNNTVSNNNVQDFYSYGVYLRSISNSTISNNDISRMTRSPLTTFYGIYFITSGENNLIEANEIHDAFTGVGGISTSASYVIYHSSVDATIGNANKVVNNLIYNINSNGTIYALYNLGSDGVYYYHNTVSLDDAASTAGTTRGFYQTTTASDIEFKNNIITITKGGTGIKYCIYFAAATSTILSNNNVFYINAPAGTNNLGYYTAAQTTLVDWQTASAGDANSADVDPIYVNILSNNYAPTNVAIDGIADNTVGVINDFFGIARAVTPDPGAIEFMPPACVAPSALTATNITATSADLGWTENGSATLWQLEGGLTGFVLGTGTSGNVPFNPFNSTGLTANTTYDFYVRSICGPADTSTWYGPYTFTTLCNAMVAPWNESFENAGTIPSCWNQGIANAEAWKFSNTGSGNHLGNNGTMGGATTSGAYFAWVDDSSPNSLNTTLESPLVDVSALTTPELSFYLISNNEGVTNVDFSIDVWDGAAWNVGFYTHNTNTVAGAWEKIVVNLSALTITGNIQFRFIVNETNGTDFYDDVAIDDVDIHEMPACPAPSVLTATNITSTSADLGWTENGAATTWNIEWDTTGFVQGTGTSVITTTNPHNLTGLTANTTYDFYVRAICGPADTSTWYGPYSFFTGYCTPAPSSVDGLGITNVTVGTINNTTGAEPGNYGDYSSQITTIAQATNVTVNITYATGYTYDTKIWIDWNDNLDFNDAGDEIYVGTSLATNPTTLVASFTVPVAAPLGNHRMRIGGQDIGPAIPCYTGSYGTFEDYTVNVILAPSCLAPSALTATNITATTADLGWLENGTATTWNIEWDTTGFAQGTGTSVITTTNPHNLTGLTPNTTYDFYVRAVCGAADSSIWVGPFTFTTPCYSITSFPYFEDFETGRNCWTENNTANGSWGFGTPAMTVINSAASGVNAFATGNLTGTYNPNENSMVTSPTFDFTGVNNPKIEMKVWWNAEFSWDGAVLQSSIDGGGTWQNVGAFGDTVNWYTDNTINGNPGGQPEGWSGRNSTSNGSGSWLLASHLLTGLNNQSNVILRIAFGSDGSVQDNGFAFDDVHIFEAITCSDPSNLTAFNIQPTSAMLDWTENGTATTWNIEWGFQGFVLGTGTPQVVLAKPYLLQGLMPNTPYDYYVQADCGTDSSGWVGPYTFMTPPCMPIGLYLGADTTLCSNQSLTLNAPTTGPYSWSWSTGQNTPSIVLDTTILGGNGVYNVSVIVTDFITGCIYVDDINLTFSPCIGINENNASLNFAIYPNPSNGLFTIINPSGENATIEIMNIQGQVVYKNNS
ncbi:MAG: hypothetical protein CO118_10755, partial [Flavobacteriales bacterium CG_4_9_14_3_um_filter_32_8]